MDDSKIKVMIENDEVIQMLEKRVETISDDRWKKIIEDFQKLHENEERIELQLELEETQRQMKEVQKEKEKAEKKVEEKDQEIKQMIQVMLANGMSLELISKSLSKSEDEIT
jgi:DNA-binding transcriptional MerR regulator